jgi:hypothetical protein
VNVGLIVFVVIFLGLATGFVARYKALGNFWTWTLFGAALFILAFPMVLIAKDRRRRCPHCAERVNEAARVCPHCQRELAEGLPA